MLLFIRWILFDRYLNFKVRFYELFSKVIFYALIISIKTNMKYRKNVNVQIKIVTIVLISIITFNRSIQYNTILQYEQTKGRPTRKCSMLHEGHSENTNRALCLNVMRCFTYILSK